MYSRLDLAQDSVSFDPLDVLSDDRTFRVAQLLLQPLDNCFVVTP